MAVQSPAELVKKKCLPCEGGVDACPIDEARAAIEAT